MEGRVTSSQTGAEPTSMPIDPAITTIFDGGRATARQLRKSKLVITSGPDAGKEYELNKPRVTGGRSIINEIALSDKAVSGSHFEIISEDEGYRLKDLNSTNGTYVRDLRVMEVFLRPGTTFRRRQAVAAGGCG